MNFARCTLFISCVAGHTLHFFFSFEMVWFSTIRVNLLLLMKLRREGRKKKEERKMATAKTVGSVCTVALLLPLPSPHCTGCAVVAVAFVVFVVVFFKIFVIFTLWKCSEWWINKFRSFLLAFWYAWQHFCFILLLCVCVSDTLYAQYKYPHR